MEFTGNEKFLVEFTGKELFLITKALQLLQNMALTEKGVSQLDAIGLKITNAMCIDLNIEEEEKND